MTIRKGEPWGTLGDVPAGALVASSDAEVRRAVVAARQAGGVVPPLRLTGGDLHRTLGGRPPGTGEARAAGDHPLLPVDLGTVVADGREHCFVAHLVARRGWWHGRIWVAMNAQFVGRWDVAPRSHPNDGLLDVLDVRQGLGDRLKARRRLPSGTHVPHPAIAERRVAGVEVDLGRPLDLWLDGERVDRARHLVVGVEPDALLCVL